MKSRDLVEFVDAGIDWITVTAKDENKIESLRHFAYALIGEELDKGNFGKPWFQSGYVGVACGHLQFGDRPDGCILRLGGELAKREWSKVVPLCDNVTRIDMQVTVRSPEAPALVVHRHFKEIQRNRRSFKRAPTLTRICNDDGGYTLYTGRRCSNVMGRIYDKASESKLAQFERCVRYEVQFMGKRARWVAKATLASLLTSGDVARTVMEFFLSRGASLRKLLEKLCSVVSIETRCASEGKTDTTRKLEWLLKSVRPSVRHLINLGLRAHVLGVLGINDSIPIAGLSTA